MKKIVVIPNENKDINLKITKKLIKILSDRACIYMEKKFEDTGFQVEFKDSPYIYNDADFVIVLGGDGTILNVCEPCGRRGIPVMGINLGKVGFMTEVNTDEIESAVNALLEDKFIIEKRMMMKVIVNKENDDKKEYHALNDVVISKCNTSMISIELHSENEKINAYTADGLIISTPTGSTGYSLSAGGPVADPTMELFIASPICAHMLHARPALMPVNKEIVMTILNEHNVGASVTIDGNEVDKITPEDKVIVQKSQYYVKIIKIGKQSFYDVLADKLK